MDCQRVTELLYLFADRELQENEAIPYEEHVGSCPTCARQTRYTHRFLTLVRKRAGRFTPPAELRTRILTVLATVRTQRGRQKH